MKKFSVVLFVTLASVSAIAHAEVIERYSYKPSEQEACSTAQEQIKSQLRSPYDRSVRAGGNFVTSTDDPIITDSSGAWQGRPMFKCSQSVTWQCEPK